VTNFIQARIQKAVARIDVPRVNIFWIRDWFHQRSIIIALYSCILFLIYSISNFTPKLSRAGITNEIQRAFTKWSRYSRITFSEVYNVNADILISFGISNHGDQ